MLYQIQGFMYLRSCSCSNGYIKLLWKKKNLPQEQFVFLSQL